VHTSWRLVISCWRTLAFRRGTTYGQMESSCFTCLHALPVPIHPPQGMVAFLQADVEGSCCYYILHTGAGGPTGLSTSCRKQGCTRWLGSKRSMTHMSVGQHARHLTCAHVLLFHMCCTYHLRVVYRRECVAKHSLLDGNRLFF
jgi:hypothetical protein